MMNERISALMDGELSGEEAAAVLEWIKHNPEAAEVWASYHVIGESLKHHDFLASNIRSRVASRLEQEPTILSPASYSKPVKRTWIALSAAASIAAVAVLGVVSFQRTHQAEQQTVVVAQKTNNLDLNPYLAAHQQYAAQAGGRPQVRPVSMDNPEGLSK
ncbi:sigma-E factor negative regulatory protein [Leeia sp. TBRC 13508]|uniref:Sigma-E factor negative regulatory protein n=1 Tax=Leeia speluncae TaxID=2884804 RepID=A0ABS8D2N4_9NEIS|nr:sigma-E factor negative regulatory protein [Leeia speluncae]MCB6182246.1 sigma-E factor negative regulatory protein [Leeia speluncae]